MFSARPQDRASCFKALLEVTDLEDFRNQVAALDEDIAASANPLIEKLELASGVAGAARLLNPLLAEVPAPADLTAALAACCKELVAAHSEISPAEPDALFACLASLLADKRSKTFALKGFDRRALASWSGPSDTQHDALACYIAERAKVDEEMQRLTNLFREMLALSSVAAADVDTDRPLCGSEAALAPARIAFIREPVANTEMFQQAQADAGDALTQMRALVKGAIDGIGQALPLFITNSPRLRRAKGSASCQLNQIVGVLVNDRVGNGAWSSRQC